MKKQLTPYRSLIQRTFPVEKCCYWNTTKKFCANIQRAPLDTHIYRLSEKKLVWGWVATKVLSAHRIFQQPLCMLFFVSKKESTCGDKWMLVTIKIIHLSAATWRCLLEWKWSNVLKWTVCRGVGHIVTETFEALKSSHRHPWIFGQSLASQVSILEGLYMFPTKTSHIQMLKIPLGLVFFKQDSQQSLLCMHNILSYLGFFICV